MEEYGAEAEGWGGEGLLALDATGFLTQDSEPGVTTLFYDHNGFSKLS